MGATEFDWTCSLCGETVRCSAYNGGVMCEPEELKHKEFEEHIKNTNENSKRT